MVPTQVGCPAATHCLPASLGWFMVCRAFQAVLNNALDVAAAAKNKASGLQHSLLNGPFANGFSSFSPSFPPDMVFGQATTKELLAANALPGYGGLGLGPPWERSVGNCDAGSPRDWRPSQMGRGGSSDPSELSPGVNGRSVSDCKRVRAMSNVRGGSFVKGPELRTWSCLTSCLSAVLT